VKSFGYGFIAGCVLEVQAAAASAVSWVSLCSPRVYKVWRSNKRASLQSRYVLLYCVWVSCKEVLSCKLVSWKGFKLLDLHWTLFPSSNQRSWIPFQETNFVPDGGLFNLRNFAGLLLHLEIDEGHKLILCSYTLKKNLSRLFLFELMRIRP
jgi:hypothetical protein